MIPFISSTLQLLKDNYRVFSPPSPHFPVRNVGHDAELCQSPSYTQEGFAPLNVLVLGSCRARKANEQLGCRGLDKEQGQPRRTTRVEGEKT